MLAPRNIPRNIIEDLETSTRYRKHQEKLHNMRSQLPPVQKVAKEYEVHEKILKMRSISMNGGHEERVNQIMTQNKKILGQLFRVGSRKPSSYGIELDESSGVFRSLQSPVHLNHIMIRNIRRREEEAELNRQNQAMIENLRREKSLYGCRDLLRQSNVYTQIKARIQRMAPENVKEFSELSQKKPFSPVSKSAESASELNKARSATVASSEQKSKGTSTVVQNSMTVEENHSINILPEEVDDTGYLTPRKISKTENEGSEAE